ncbi:MAG: hypothetical protein KBS44_03375, partial [Clostridiales bacterium]|nr:hypothetical protein [Candidatus Coliplasma equi]
YLYNTAEIPGAITSVVVVATPASDSYKFQKNLYCAVDDEKSQGDVASIDGLTPGARTNTSFTFNFDAADDYRYFKLFSNENFTSGNITGVTVTVTYVTGTPDDSSEAESSEEPSSEEPSSEEPSSEEPSEEPSSEPDESSESEPEQGYYLAAEIPAVGDKIVIAFKNGEDFYAFPNANHGSDTAIAATKITVADGLASVDDSVVFEIVVNSGEMGIKSIAATKDSYIGFNSNKIACNGWGDTKYAVITAAEANGTFIVGSSNNLPRGLTYSGTDFTVSNEGGAPVYIFVYGDKPEEEEDVVVSLGAKVNTISYSLRLGAKYNGKVLSGDERASVEDLGIVFYPVKFLGESELDLTTSGAAAISANSIDEEYYVDGKKFVDYETFVFYATIVNIPENGRDTDIAFRPYIIYSEGTVYGEILVRNYNGTYEAARGLAIENAENEISCPSNWFN